MINLNLMEKEIIIDALRKTGGIQVKAADILGINQRSLWHRIKKLQIDINSYKESTIIVDKTTKIAIYRSDN